MNKRFRLIKSKIAPILVVLMCINSFAAVVGDNDGAAFITKAEFESLKNDFQTQINRYNSSLDDKIDGAIASYLAGVRVAKETAIKPLVSNYKDINWKNDLYMKLKCRTFIGTQDYYDDSTGWRVPIFGNYRILRAARYYMSPVHYFDTVLWSFVFGFNFSTGNWYFFDSGKWFTPVAGNSGYRFDATLCPLVVCCKDKYNGYPKIASEGNILKKDNIMYNRALPQALTYTAGASAADTLYQHNEGGKIGPGTDGGLLYQPPASGDILAFKLRWYKLTGDYRATSPTGSQYESWGEFHLNRKYAGFGEQSLVDWNDSANVTAVNPTAYSFSEPRYYYIPLTNEQLAADHAVINNIMLATDSKTKVNCAVELSSQGPTVYKTFDYSDSEMATISTTNYNVQVAVGGTNFKNEWKLIDDIGTTLQCDLRLPLNPVYYLKDLYQTKFQYHENPIQVGGGLPIADSITAKGTLNVKLKSIVYNGDVDDTSEVPQKIYLSFKNGSFNKSSSKYFSDEDGKKLQDVEFETTTTNTTYEVNIPVEVDENVWMRIGPKNRSASGLYAKLTDLQVTLITE